MWVGRSLPLAIHYMYKSKICQIMTKIITIMAKYGLQKMNVGTDESFLKLNLAKKLLATNGEKCGWLKQMQAANEKRDSNKW